MPSIAVGDGGVDPDLVDGAMMGAMLVEGSRADRR